MSISILIRVTFGEEKLQASSGWPGLAAFIQLMAANQKKAESKQGEKKLQKTTTAKKIRPADKILRLYDIFVWSSVSY